MRLPTSAALSLQSAAAQLQVLSRVDATRLADVLGVILRSCQRHGPHVSHCVCLYVHRVILRSCQTWSSSESMCACRAAQAGWLLCWRALRRSSTSCI